MPDPDRHDSNGSKPVFSQQQLPPAMSPDLFAPLVGPFVGMARQAQMAMADATMAGWRGALQNAQSAMQTTQQAIEAAKTITERSTAVVTQPASQAASVQAPSYQAPSFQVPGLEAASLESVAQRNMDALQVMTALATKRTQALMEFPSRLAQCKGPQDVLSEQLRFWQLATQDCTDTGQRMMAAWGQGLAPASTAGASTRGASAAGKLPSAQQILAGKGAANTQAGRDTVTFRDPPTPSTDGRNPDGSTRRAS